MNVVLFLVRRFISSNRTARGFSIFSLIVMGGIAVGVATLIIALTVLKGFQTILRDKLISMDSHVQIISLSDAPIRNSVRCTEAAKNVFGDKIVEMTLYIKKMVLLHHSGKREGVLLRGVPPGYFKTKNMLQSAEGRLEPDSGNTIILGKSLSEKLFVKVGDNIALFALRNGELPSPDSPPIIEQVKVAGIFESGIARFDDDVVYVSFQTAARMFDYQPDQVNGIEIKLNSIDNLKNETAELQDSIRWPTLPMSIYDLHPQIFTWIELQQKPIPIVLGLIILVAVFNVISVTLMIVLEKSSAIGILRTLGSQRKMIGRMFLLQGIYLGVVGTIAGNILAYILCAVQIKYNVITLPETVYFTSVVPMDLSLETFLFVSSIGLVLSVVVSTIPAYISSRLSPLTTIRFN